MQSSKQWIVHRKRVADKAKAIKETAGKKKAKGDVHDAVGYAEDACRDFKK